MITVKNNKVPRLFKIAEYLGINDLQDKALHFLTDSGIDDRNVYEIYKFRGYGIPFLLEKCKEFMRRNFGRISQTDDFVTFESELVYDILSKNHIYVPTNELFSGIIRWIARDVEHRMFRLWDMLNLIEVSKLDVDYLNNYFCTNEATVENPKLG